MRSQPRRLASRPDPIRLELGQKWTLLKRVRFQTEIGLVVVPAGFQTDGCSIPAAARIVVGCNLSVDLLRGCLVHDFLYAESRSGRRVCTRKEADRIMRDQHEADGADMAEIIYRAVRLGASWLWMTPQERQARLQPPHDEDFMS